MDRLKEIIQVLARRRMKRIEVFNDTGKVARSSLYYRLYQGIRDGEFTTDEEAARAIFGTDATEKKYLMLKSRVKARLLSTLMFLDNANSRYELAVIQCARGIFSAQILLQNGARSTAEAMLHSTLNQAEKFELTDVAMNCLLKLRYSAAFIGNKAAFDEYRQRYREKEELYVAESRAEEYYQVLVLPFGKSSSNRPELSVEALAFVEETERLRRPRTSFKLEMTHFRLKVMAGQISGNPEMVMQACDEGEAYLKERKHLALPIRFGEIAVYRLTVYIQLGDFERGSQLVLDSLQYFNEGSLNWMIFMESYFLLAMHTGHYACAADIYLKVTRHHRFGTLDDTRKEKWRIFEGFLQYILDGQIDPASGARFESQFKLMKFLNEVPIYSKDKRGLNIAILILQVLFLLDRRDYSGIISRAEALKVYCSRYLKVDENYRSNCFLKMMLLMEKKGFAYEETSRTSERYFALLKSHRYNYEAGNTASLEIIPYEHLWSTILGKLQAIK